MPLVSAVTGLAKARAGRYALPCFDTFEMLGTEGMFAALEAKRAPAIVAFYDVLMEQPNVAAFAAFARKLAEDATVPVSLILDHGSSFEHCIKALRLGFTDVMFDGSKLPVEENMAITKQIVRAAHAVGAGVEAEIGHVGQGSDYDSFGGQRAGFTDPAMVERFVAETGVDFLAIAIGTAHGVYKGKPEIDLELLAEIRGRVEIPLVLHGGSGLSTEQFQAAVAKGISKVNIFTDLGITAAARMKRVAEKENPGYFDFNGAIREAFCERCSYYLDTFGATGHAD